MPRSSCHSPPTDRRADRPFGPAAGLSDSDTDLELHAQISTAAVNAKIQASVGFEAIILVDGSVGKKPASSSRLDKDFGLDQGSGDRGQSLEFKPGVDRSGSAVRSSARLSWTSGSRTARPPVQVGARAHPRRRAAGFHAGRARGRPRPDWKLRSRPPTVEPKYTAAAMLAKIQGTADIDIVIGHRRTRCSRARRPVARHRQWPRGECLEAGEA